ncbi:hypothetical protein WAI453_012185 [Rhynchosporium graminicola]|uniref:Related to nuclear poly(A)-binding protein n=2 Tax=Rhynchosporium TaxID=38037 RepID=A0A1E1MDR9_RHYSE|nr:related to nuclear poly(A)-binding protein [Rhynchosporium commune]CZT47246.1 related to nuclear poly(A)-binding protein [Rhynchosporium secalis]
MSIDFAMDTPLAQALNSAIQPKLVEVGWSSGGGDESQLAEYILLMLANNKTQDQIAKELSSDLLGLGPDDPGARDFSQWLFQQIESSNNGTNGQIIADTDAQANVQDAEMGDVSEAGDGKVPTGPKSMRDGTGTSRPRDKRMLGHLAKAMDRTSESVLHRVRPQNGNERINSHSRGPPTGPRQQAPGRGGVRNLNSRMNGNPMGGMPMGQGAAAQSIMNMSQAQQMQLYQMLEQQSLLMASMMNPQQAQTGMGRGGHFGMNHNNFSQQQPGRSLFDRVQPHQRPHNNGRQFPQNERFGAQAQAQTGSEAPPSSMDVEMSSQEKKEMDPENTKCRFNLKCTMPDCKFAHQSPAAPPGAAIDFGDVCSFGAACKNKKCVGKHPSPAQKISYQTVQQCRWGADCTKVDCPFVHPTACRNGADCKVPNCKFGHTKIECKFNPCERPSCPFKHVEGQKRGKFEDKVWTADKKKEHVSERKFVEEGGPEELIIPGQTVSEVPQAATVKDEEVIS